MLILSADKLKGRTHHLRGRELVYVCFECKHTALFVNPVKSVWLCRHCNKGGYLSGDTRSLRHRILMHSPGDRRLPPRDNFSLPPHHTGLCQEAMDYLLRKRNISFDLIEDRELVEGHSGAWQNRIIFPIFWYGRTVSCVGRTYQARDPRVKYRTVSGSRHEDIYRTLDGQVPYALVVEGVIDALRAQTLGIPAIAVLGKSIAFRQREKIIEVVTKKAFVCFDSEPEAWVATLDACRTLAFALDVEPILVDKGDPGDWNEADVEKYLGHTPLVRRVSA